jgi:hypothetical protein
MYLNNVTRILTEAIHLLCSFERGISESWTPGNNGPKKRQNHTVLFILTVYTFCLGLKLGFRLFYADYWEWETMSCFLGLVT